MALSLAPRSQASAEENAAGREGLLAWGHPPHSADSRRPLRAAWHMVLRKPQLKSDSAGQHPHQSLISLSKGVKVEQICAAYVQSCMYYSVLKSVKECKTGRMKR